MAGNISQIGTERFTDLGKLKLWFESIYTTTPAALKRSKTICERVNVPSEFQLCLREFCPKVKSHLEQATAQEAPIFSQNSAFQCQ